MPTRPGFVRSAVAPFLTVLLLGAMQPMGKWQNLLFPCCWGGPAAAVPLIPYALAQGEATTASTRNNKEEEGSNKGVLLHEHKSKSPMITTGAVASATTMSEGMGTGERNTARKGSENFFCTPPFPRAIFKLPKLDLDYR